MNFDLTEDQRKLQATVADFAQSEVAPVAEALDRDGVFPTELFKKAGELGITAIPFSEDLGGMGLGVLDMVIALEQLARADQSLAVSVMVSVASGLTLGRFGDAELARKYLPDIIAGRKICGIAGTEPNAGSDTSAFTTRASQRGNGWRLNGEKAFITNGGTDISSFLMILAVSSPPDAAKKSFTLFLVPNGAQGFTPGERYRKMGWRSSDTRPYYLQDCDIDQDHIIGPVHGGRIVLHRGYQQARVFLAACSLGLAQACLDHSLTFAKERKAFGGADRPSAARAGDDCADGAADRRGAAAHLSSRLERGSGPHRSETACDGQALCLRGRHQMRRSRHPGARRLGLHG